MIPCNKNHVQIWHMERFCPLCTAINLVEVERMYLENQKKIDIHMEGLLRCFMSIANRNEIENKKLKKQIAGLKGYINKLKKKEDKKK